MTDRPKDWRIREDRGPGKAIWALPQRSARPTLLSSSFADAEGERLMCFFDLICPPMLA